MDIKQTRIAILTITDGANYGNRLQNYALQQILKTFPSVIVETIQRKTSRDYSVYRLIVHNLKQSIKKVLGEKQTDFISQKRKARFKTFNKKIKFSHYCLHDNIAPVGIDDDYEYFVCGSDQIWNTRFDIVNSDIMNHLAAFASPNKRISYAASFGTDYVNKKYENIFISELSKFKAISVREKAGKEIIESLTGRKDVEVVFDPTLLMDRETWKQIERKPQYIKKKLKGMKDSKFLVTYFLSSTNDQIKHHIDMISRIYKAPAINLDIEFLTDDLIENIDFFCTAPDEFIWLIRNSECIITDSFHATALSIIFGKPFVVYNRVATENDNDMNSRITSLLETFGLERFIDDFKNPKKIPEKYNADEINIVLQSQREKSIRFLQYALDRPRNSK